MCLYICCLLREYECSQGDDFEKSFEFLNENSVAEICFLLFFKCVLVSVGAAFFVEEGGCIQS